MKSRRTYAGACSRLSRRAGSVLVTLMGTDTHHCVTTRQQQDVVIKYHVSLLNITAPLSSRMKVFCCYLAKQVSSLQAVA